MSLVIMAISPLMWVMTIVTLLITPLITAHEPPSMLFLKLGTASAGLCQTNAIALRMDHRPLRGEVQQTRVERHLEIRVLVKGLNLISYHHKNNTNNNKDL